MDEVNDRFLDTVTCADVVDVLPQIDSESIDLVCTDPPYNLGKDYGNTVDAKAWHEYEQFTVGWLSECQRVLKRTGSIYVFMGVRFIAKLYVLLEDMGFLFNGWITWHYTQGMGRKRGFSPRHEDILHFTRSKRFTFHLDDVRVPQKYFRQRNNMAGANPGDVWAFSHVHYCAAQRKPHPTQKPEGAIERIIRASSNEDDVILDPFLGSGTTARVARALKRHYIGIEINPDYASLARARIDEPFLGFDSVDPRADRTPRDLPKGDDSNDAGEGQPQRTLF